MRINTCRYSATFASPLRSEGPDGTSFRVPGFYAGMGIWRVRFSPTKTGEWSYVLRSTTIAGVDGTAGAVECTADDGSIHGCLRVREEYPLHFAFDDDTPHFMNAYECDWLWALDLESGDLSKTTELVDSIKSHHFNTVIMNVYAHDCGWAKGKTSDHDYGPPATYAWEGTNEQPDHSKLNTAFFDHLDRVVSLIADSGLMIHLFIKVYNKMVNWPGYFTTKEHRKSIDFFTAQQHTDYYYAALAGKERYGVPYFNSEFGYEHGPGGMDDFTYGVRHSPEELVARAYEVTMAGAYPAYYYTNTAWDVVDSSYDPPGCGYFKILYDFFTSIEWWKFEPTLELALPGSTLCLARREEELIIYRRPKESDRLSIFLTAPLDYTAYEGFWMDIFSGERFPIGRGSVRPNTCGLTHIDVPFPAKTAVLYLKRR